MNSLRIGILGTRGIPNRYGGFEQCAEHLAAGLVKKGHNVWVYNSHNHEYRLDTWNGVNIIHCYDPEKTIGTAGQFIYDLNCIMDARKRKFHVLLQLGYTSNSIWHKLWPSHCKNVVNMDGLEWMRSKYSKRTQKFLKHAERWAALNADVLVADSPGIEKHLNEEYGKLSHFIAYGADVFSDPYEPLLEKYDVQRFDYNMLMARMEPENNIEIVLKAHVLSGTSRPVLIIGKTDNNYGRYLVGKYGQKEGVRFLGGIYDMTIINNLRYFSHLYFHGHSVGGTNPSLLEAMASNSLVAAHDNLFNRSVLGVDAFYFADAEQLIEIIRTITAKNMHGEMMENNLRKIRDQYNWPHIVDEYEKVLLAAAK